MQDLIKISRNLKLEAISLLNKIDLESILKQYFNIYYTGSFSYDLMSWKDIDIVLQLKDNTQKVNNLFSSMFASLINKDRIIKIYYIDTIHSHHKKGMPKGLCLGFDIYNQSLSHDCSEVINNKWKIDMWLLDCKHFRKNRNFDHNLKLKLNSEKQKRIINLKFELMDGSLNIPILASYYIYNTVLLKNMTNDKEIIKYVKSKILK